MSEQLMKEVEELKGQHRILSTQLNSHKEVINNLMQENLNARANFSLSQQYLGESVQVSQKLNADISALKAEGDALKAEMENLKKENAELRAKLPAECEIPAEECAAVADAA